MTKIKLCGLSCVEDIRAANELCPEFIGFVFAEKSRRYISPEKAAALKKILRKEISAVGVFVDAEIKTVATLANQNIIDAIQLHGNEDDDYIKNLRALTDKLIIKAVHFDALKNFAADFLLIDSGAGDGKIFDWSLIKNFSRPYFLAGGLTPENVSAAIKFLKPFAVDVSSGIETNGRKDAAKMREFVTAARGAIL
ncbi:MAG: phosphoribosylanthranilate isomerase [Selenomonadaceae bacterium]|nr:phosphoribosylanthranilate isomerase [Selenomonadaceae bacterium]